MKRALAIAIVPLALLAACGGDDDDAATAATTSSSSSTTVAAATDAEQVDANTATVDEMTAAFEAAGIPSASRWAHEVEEYRPYDTSDPTFAHLRQELAKYNPSAETIDAIVAALSL